MRRFAPGRGNAALSGAGAAALRWYQAVPAVQWLPAYERRWLRPDILAALAVWAVLVPQALAYASLAGVPAQAGLYAGLAALVVYALLGTSRHLNVGPSSSIAALSAATIAPLAVGDAGDYVTFSAAAAVLAGGVLVAAGAARLGFLAEFFARPVLIGFVTGLALTIGMSQAPRLFGVTVENGNFFEELWRLVGALDETNPATFAVGVGAVATIVLLSRFVPKIPAALVVLVGGIAVSSAFDLESHGVAIVGDVPRGLPSFGLPRVSLAESLDLVPGAAALALLAFAESVGGARQLSARHGYEVDPNKELVALGAANLGAGLSQGFAVDGSLSRSAVGETAGVKTQLSALVGAVLLLVTLFALAPLFHDLPYAVLAALVITAVAHLVDLRGIRRLYFLDERDFGLALLSLMGVLLLGILPGLLTAVVASLLALVVRAYRPSSAVLGRVPGGAETDEFYRFRDLAQHPDYETFPGLVIFRFDNELFFANANGFRAQIRELVRSTTPRPVEILVDAGSIPYMDTTATDMLHELVAELARGGVEFALARAKGPLREILRRSGLDETIGSDRIYPNVHAGVDSYLRRHPDVRPATRR